MAAFLVFFLGYFAVECVHGNVVKPINNAKDCVKEFDICIGSTVKESECRNRLERCISKHSVIIIPENKQQFIENFKCCFVSLSSCIKNEERKNKWNSLLGVAADKNVCKELKGCSDTMMRCCTKGDPTPLNQLAFAKQSPGLLRQVFARYGVCVKTAGCINKCVVQSHQQMEQLLGSDCLNKYIHCAYSSTEQQHVSCQESLKTCMAPAKCGKGPIFKSQLINDIWSCTDISRKKNVVDSLKCILQLYKRSITYKKHISRLLSKEHIKVSCYLVYGGDNFTTKTDYESCVENNITH